MPQAVGVENEAYLPDEDQQAPQEQIDGEQEYYLYISEYLIKYLKLIF